MSYFWNLAIDCGPSEEVADRMMSHFTPFRILLPDAGEVAYQIWGKTQSLGHWYVGVFPVGMGYGDPDARPELVEPHNYAPIQRALYDHLALITGYRRAYFGCEAWYDFTNPFPDELDRIDLPEMIYAIDCFPTLPEESRSVPFSPGYRQVTEVPGLP